MRTPGRSFVTVAIRVAAACLAAAGCDDSRTTSALPQVSPPDPAVGASGGARAPAVRTSDLRAGGGAADVAVRNPYADDPDALRIGRALYGTMNCSGCHGSNGGGGIGPPLSDEAWIYGGQLENIVQTIVQGRPNGMPSFGGKLPEREMWKIAVFVQSLSSAGEGRR